MNKYFYTPKELMEDVDKDKIEREHFYSAKPIKITVTKKEFQDFLNQYPRKLSIDVCGISDPPAISYNDFELANKWPYNIVASTFGYDDNPDSPWYSPEESRIYSIVINYEELYKSRIRNEGE